MWRRARLPASAGCERRGAGVGQGDQPGHVDVIGVLVRDQHRVQVADRFERRHGARVDQQPAAVGLDEEAGVAEVGELHRDSWCFRSSVGSARGSILRDILSL